MRAVNISKSLMIIGGIEKYAALKKKKQKASTAVQHKVLQKPTKKEVEQEEEKKHGNRRRSRSWSMGRTRITPRVDRTCLMLTFRRSNLRRRSATRKQRPLLPTSSKGADQKAKHTRLWILSYL
ncbi:hypothetical protein BT69DRAFT_727299 [Atractiella rhizophila]|nr:hypothetical protein BT69DRAFT_727299 [Atractiella rhizophila]